MFILLDPKAESLELGSPWEEAPELPATWLESFLIRVVKATTARFACCSSPRTVYLVSSGTSLERGILMEPLPGFSSQCWGEHLGEGDCRFGDTEAFPAGAESRQSSSPEERG